MLKMTIDNEEVVSDKDITINEEMLSASSTILNNVYPKEWEEDKDYTSKFYYPQDYSKALIQRSYVTQEAEAGTTIQVNGSVTLTDVDTTKNSRVLRLLGQTSQSGTPTPSTPIPVNVVSGDNEIDVNGKNWLNTLYQHDVGEVVTTNGVTFTFNEDGSIKLSGTATSNAYVMLYGELSQFSTTLFKLPSTFKASGEITYPIGIIGRVTGSGTYQELRTATGGTEYGCVFLQVVSGQSVNTTIYPQIEKGNEITSYEPYIGNTYNIDLPVENLFNKDSVVLEKVWNGGNNTKRAYGYIEAIQGQQYTISCNNTNSDLTIYVVETTTVGQAGTNIRQATLTNSTPQTFIPNANTKYIVIQFSTTNNDTTQEIVDNAYVMIAKGRTSKTFFPYGTTPIELCKIGNYQDYIYKDSDKWYLHKEINKVVLNGSETWEEQYTNGWRTGITNLKQTTSGNDNSYVISNYYQVGSQNAVFVSDYGICNRANNSQIIIKNKDIANLTGFKTWLSTHNTEVYYVLATPTNTEITYQPLIEQLNALSSQ